MKAATFAGLAYEFVPTTDQKIKQIDAVLAGL